MEILANLISPNGLKFSTMTHTKASSQTSVRTWATAVCSAIHQDNSLRGALLSRKDITEESFLNPNMTAKQKHKIFNALYKSFDTDVLNYLNLQFNETVEMDALLLWKKFQEAYEKTQYDELEQESLKKKYRDITINKDEKMHKYIIRYQYLEQELKENGLSHEIKSSKMKACKFIFSLRDPTHADTVKQIISGSNTSFNNLSFPAIICKLESLKTAEAGIEWYEQQRKSEQERLWNKFKSHTKPSPTRGGQLSNKLNPANPYNKMTESQRIALKNNKKITDWLNDRKPLRNGKHVKDFEYTMYDKAANAKTVLEFSNKMPDSCYLHPGSNHKLLNCDLACDICSKCKKESILNHAIGLTEGQLTNLKIKHSKSNTKRARIRNNQEPLRRKRRESQLWNPTWKILTQHCPKLLQLYRNSIR